MINMGYQVSQGLQAWDTQNVLTYPCEGSTLVSYQLANEPPNPVPNRDLRTQPLGTSVIIMVKPGNEHNSTFASMIQVSNQKVVQLRSVVGGLSGQPSVVPNGVFYGAGSAYVAADAPLESSESYQVSMSGTNNGVPFTRNFVFTTGPAGMLGQ
ncbi:MAG: hypothetical protein EXR35_04030 [Limnohabitans sp.]|nr:hypothetical protein [Limnohabitans sp.]